MTEGKLREAWQHTALLAAGVYRMTADPKKKAPKPEDFNPFNDQPKPAPLGVNEARAMFLRHAKKKPQQRPPSSTEPA